MADSELALAAVRDLVGDGEYGQAIIKLGEVFEASEKQVGERIDGIRDDVVDGVGRAPADSIDASLTVSESIRDIRKVLLTLHLRVDRIKAALSEGVASKHEEAEPDAPESPMRRTIALQQNTIDELTGLETTLRAEIADKNVEIRSLVEARDALSKTSVDRAAEISKLKAQRDEALAERDQAIKERDEARARAERCDALLW